MVTLGAFLAFHTSAFLLAGCVLCIDGSLTNPPSDEMIHAQMEVLNTFWRRFMGITFDLRNITRNVNPYWYNDASIDGPATLEMMTNLRVGDRGTLNVYTLGRVSLSL